MAQKNHIRPYCRINNPILFSAVFILAAVSILSCTDTKSDRTTQPARDVHAEASAEQQPVPIPNERFRSDEPLTGGELWMQIVRVLDKGHTISEIQADPYLVLDKDDFDNFFETDPADSFGRWLPWQTVFEQKIPGKNDSPELPFDAGGSFLMTPETDLSDSPWSDSVAYDDSSRIVIRNNVMRITSSKEESWFVRIGPLEMHEEQKIPADDSTIAETPGTLLLFGNTLLHQLVLNNTAQKGIPISIETLINSEHKKSLPPKSNTPWNDPFKERSAPSLNVRNLWGQTPVMLAIKSGNADLVNYLINNGSNLWLRDMLGRTHLDYIDLYLAQADPEHKAISILVNNTLRFQSAVPPAGFKPGGKPNITAIEWMHSYESTLAPLLREASAPLPPRRQALSGTFPFGYRPGNRAIEKPGTIYVTFTKTPVAQLVHFNIDGRPIQLPHNLQNYFSKIFQPVFSEQENMIWVRSARFEDYDLSDTGHVDSTILYLVDGATGDRAFIHAHNDNMWIASVAPDANRLLLTLGTSRLAAVDTDGKTHILPFTFDGADWKIHTKLQWLNNNEVLAITAEKKLIRYDVSTGTTSLVAEDVDGFAAHPWSADQEVVYMEGTSYAHWKSLRTNTHKLFPVQGADLESVMFDPAALSCYLNFYSFTDEGERWSLVHLDRTSGKTQIVEDYAEDKMRLLSIHPATGDLLYSRTDRDRENRYTTTILSFNTKTSRNRTLAVLPGWMFGGGIPYYSQNRPRLLFELWENQPSEWYDGTVFLWIDMTTGETGNYSNEQFLRPEGGRACPHLHIHDGSSWQLIGEIIGANSSRFFSGTDSTPVPPHLIRSGQLRIKITEDLFETTYLDSVWLTAGGRRIYARNHPANLREQDTNYLVLEKGDQVELVFDVPAGLEANAVLEFSGYYVNYN